MTETTFLFDLNQSGLKDRDRINSILLINDLVTALHPDYPKELFRDLEYHSKDGILVIKSDLLTAKYIKNIKDQVNAEISSTDVSVTTEYTCALVPTDLVNLQEDFILNYKHKLLDSSCVKSVFIDYESSTVTFTAKTPIVKSSYSFNVQQALLSCIVVNDFNKRLADKTAFIRPTNHLGYSDPHSVTPVKSVYNSYNLFNPNQEGVVEEAIETSVDWQEAALDIETRLPVPEYFASADPTNVTVSQVDPQKTTPVTLLTKEEVKAAPQPIHYSAEFNSGGAELNHPIEKSFIQEEEELALINHNNSLKLLLQDQLISPNPIQMDGEGLVSLNTVMLANKNTSDDGFVSTTDYRTDPFSRQE